MTGALVSSAVVAAIVGGLSSFLTQRYLLARKAHIDYELMARKRLYEVVGPLRVQLLFAARDLVRRSKAHAGTQWNMDPADHFVRSFIYRLLRPLAVAQLIERQMSVADFSVDRDVIKLLQFSTAAERMLCDYDTVLDHPGADWSHQSQHLFRDNLRVAAARLIYEHDDGAYVLDYGRFQRDVPDPRHDDALRDLALIFERCASNLTENPLFWLRVVGYSHVCNRLIDEEGERVGFDRLSLDVVAMLSAVEDEYIARRVSEFQEVFEQVARPA